MTCGKNALIKKTKDTHGVNFLTLLTYWRI
ncbi:MAG: CRISPR-associated DxTHG motif protein [Nitrosopumilus sp.]|nr:CRISPR-associated DxTHG motif protein [Nitrosopumilus sp.]